MDSRKENALKMTYSKLLEVGFGEGSIEEIPEFIAADAMGYGTALDEKILSIDEFTALMHDQRKQAANFDDFRYASNPVIMRISDNGNSALIVDEIELETVINNESNILSIRMSTIMEFKDNTWKVIHWHGSLPEHISEGEDPWHVNEWKKKTEKLEKMVDEKTTDLERKTRELEIETTLERVRTIAMGMRKSEDLLDVCKAISEQLELLQITDIRNIQVAIVDEANKNYLNYQYFTPYSEKVFEVTEYENHPASQAMVTEMQKSANSFFTGKMEGKDLDSFRNWRNQYDQFPDPLLDQSSAVYYYFYSIGTGGLGLTTYNEITERSLEIFKRFHKVFTLAYQRFRDIEKAETQAREALIEAALERVRSRSIAMHHTSELQDVINTVHKEFSKLEMDITGGAFIAINSDIDKEISCWGAGGTTDYIQRVHIPFLDRPIYTDLVKEIKKGQGLFTNEYTAKEKKEFFEYLFKHPPYTNATAKRKKEVMARPGGYTRACFVSDNTTIFIINHHGRPFQDADLEILKRFGRVFEGTYTRFLDLKKAEAQAREAQIETALERVRSRSMGMQKSEELADLSFELVKQVDWLGIDTWFCAFNIYDDDPQGSLEWGSNTQGTYEKYRTPREGIFLRYYEAGQKGETLLINEIGEDECPAHYEYLCSLPGVGEQLVAMKDAGIPFPTSQIDHVAFFKYGYIIFITFEPVPEAHDIFKRFAKVFEQTFTRFLDLQKAEAQAREAQIEAALEKVRSRTMAMQHSDELPEAANVLFNEVRKLGINAWSAGYNILSEDKQSCSCVMSSEDILQAPFRLPLTGEKSFVAWLDAIKSGVDFFTQELKGKAIKEHYEYLMTLPGIDKAIEGLEEAGIPFPTHQFNHLSFFSKGFLLFITYEPVPEAHSIFNGFTAVFEQTYTRFLDLKHAEEQAREAQVELSLERIGAQVTAMSESAELLDIVVTMRTEFVALGHEAHYFWYMRYTEKTYEKAMTSGDGTRIGMVMTLPRHIHGDIKLVADWEKSDEPTIVFAMDTDTAVDYVHKMITLGDFKQVDPQAPTLDDIRDLGGLTFVMARTQYGEIGFSLPGFVTDPPQESLETLERFAGVFDLAYRRFEDLQTAEKQNRETQIELSLERIRAKTMAMHNSDEVGQSVMVLFQELKHLGLDELDICGIGIIQENKLMEAWTASNMNKSGSKLVIGRIDMEQHALLQGVYQGWEKKKESFHYVLEGQDKTDYFNNITNQRGYKAGRELSKISDRLVLNAFYFNEGCLYAFSSDEISSEKAEIFKRFAGVFGLTYRRYLDLQIAEAQTREAVKQASLERVRGQISSMRTLQDLQRITPLIWQELETLEVPFFRCGVFIVDRDREIVDVYLTTPDAKPLGALHLPFDTNELTRDTVSHWKKQQVYTAHWDKKVFSEWMQSMIQLGQIKKEDYQGGAEPPENLYLHFIPFDQGMLYVGHSQALKEDQINLVKSLAETFAIAYARYEDFKHLEEAKAKVEKTLSELKDAQSQLIHAEKMASLGELTAGIAHEIQNPLNFVNNFSEVSVDLVEEMEEEMEEGNAEEALNIAEDLKQNLGKIHHHGQRASSIVKGMLEHSRSGTGEKTSTDINALADEYLRLAYHGLRAKNKSFQADFKLESDPSIPKINTIGQDIGRVLLNLINNAFYAVSSKASQEGNNGYKPVVYVFTKNIKDNVEIRVKDNGNGIPKNVLDKIFQPFFTTKPTGEGTGLGLSLSYDIITKGHGGKLKVETKEGEGTEFIINLPTL